MTFICDFRTYRGAARAEAVQSAKRRRRAARPALPAAPHPLRAEAERLSGRLSLSVDTVLTYLRRIERIRPPDAPDDWRPRLDLIAAHLPSVDPGVARAALDSLATLVAHEGGDVEAVERVRPRGKKIAPTGSKDDGG